MKHIRKFTTVFLGTVMLMHAGETLGQIVINEVVKEQRDGTNDGASVNPDVTEFVEFYNTGASPIDLTGWTLGTINLVTGTPEFTDTIPGGIIAPGGFFVIGGAGVPNVNYTPIAGEIWTDVVPRIMELKNPAATLVDAIGYDIWRTGLTRLTNATPSQLAQIGSGYQGELFSVSFGPTIPTVSSWSRYLDGRDTNKNGLDFGYLPPTPGQSNSTNLPGPRAFSIPDVDALATGSDLSSMFHASFVLPRVIDPLVADSNNPRALPSASPQGNKAIVAWDPSYGGNAVHAKELTNSFKMSAYFDTAPIGVGPITVDQEWETTIYGIGSTDPFFRTPDPTGGIGQVPAGGAELVTRNASTGVGWVYQRFENGAAPATGFNKLMLIDFGDSGESEGETPDGWKILHTIDMSALSAGWFELGLNYNSVGNQITGIFNGQNFTFTLPYDLLGTFFIGYREGITGTDLYRDKHDPPTFDLISVGLTGDYNGNGKVDAADYVVWRNGGAPDSTVAGYNLWRLHFGEGSGSGAGAVGGAVPEPASLVLVALGLAAVCGRRRAAG